ncbi:MAG: hypothetical protein GYA51_19030 [Candidatus Methanofastidiosa archaeon]|nr:hypothetical protein [Candidatus Methanofastidiosa archaeon]
MLKMLDLYARLSIDEFKPVQEIKRPEEEYHAVVLSLKNLMRKDLVERLQEETPTGPRYLYRRKKF